MHNYFTALGEFLGAPCEETCSSMLINVYCKPETLRCECIKGYPVNIGISRGCAKRKLFSYVLYIYVMDLKKLNCWDGLAS